MEKTILTLWSSKAPAAPSTRPCRKRSSTPPFSATRRPPAAEWLAEFRSDLADFVDRAVVDAAVVAGRHELPPTQGCIYHAVCDPAGDLPMHDDGAI